ncbi:amino acid ABC transporter permease [Methylobacterium sp. J-070]|uniref:amino acid ABC transporter permease n=1 Tax=Methylobacterium sp. J-070 TaxID=2836650 RepID=UPI001FB8B23A|nr:amino acid ABC transporter permease [Methylobacterium sp. J-070]MCJ2048843.1 amino acid ABC transporter permease [Methylobacterium sp. J-070]
MSGIATVWSYRDAFLAGLGNTAALVGLALVLSLPLAALAAVLLVEASAPVRRLGREVVDLFRCVPFLLLAYVIYYGLPEIGLRLGAWWAGLVALVLYNGAYFTEILRAAALSLPREAVEAGRAYGFSRAQLYGRIVLPLVALDAGPVIGNQIVVMIKDTALLMVITVQELSFVANFVNARAFAPFAPFATALLLYWVLCLVAEAGVGLIARERRRRYG